LKLLDWNQTIVPDADMQQLREALPNTEILYDKAKVADSSSQKNIRVKASEQMGPARRHHRSNRSWLG